MLIPFESRVVQREQNRWVIKSTQWRYVTNDAAYEVPSEDPRVAVDSLLSDGEPIPQFIQFIDGLDPTELTTDYSTEPDLYKDQMLGNDSRALLIEKIKILYHRGIHLRQEQVMLLAIEGAIQWSSIVPADSSVTAPEFSSLIWLIAKYERGDPVTYWARNCQQLRKDAEFLFMLCRNVDDPVKLERLAKHWYGEPAGQLRFTMPNVVDPWVCAMVHQWYLGTALWTGYVNQEDLQQMRAELNSLECFRRVK